MAGKITNHNELLVFQRGFNAGMSIFQLSKGYSKEETYSLTDQIRRSSRSVCANIAEAWRKRRYEAAFASKLNDAEAEAAETQVWLDFSLQCGYIGEESYRKLYDDYTAILGMLTNMNNSSEIWALPRKS